MPTDIANPSSPEDPGVRMASRSGIGKRRPAVVAGLIAVSAGVALAASAGLRERATASLAEAPPRAMPVALAEIQILDGYRQRRRFVGRVEASRTSDLGFELGGQLRLLLVDEGDAVQAGQTLARLDTARLEARRAELEAALEADRAELSLATSTRERIAALSDNRHASRQRLDEVEERLEAAKAALALTRSRIETVQTDISKAQLAAPFAGVVTRRLADEGRVVGAGETVFTVQERLRPLVRIGVNGAAADRIRVGDRHRLDIAGRRFDASVRAVIPLTGARTRTVDVLLDLDTGSTAFASLRPGDLAELSVERTIETRGAWVPLSAVTVGRRGLWVVYGVRPVEALGLAGASYVVEPRIVEVVAQDGLRAYVRGAIADGVHVVAEGLNRIVPGQRVRLAVGRTGGQ